MKQRYGTFGPFGSQWNYDLTHPSLTSVVRLTGKTVRWFGVSIGNLGIGIMWKRPDDGREK